MSEFDDLYGTSEHPDDTEGQPVADPVVRSEFDDLYDDVSQSKESQAGLNLQEGQTANPDDFAQRRSLAQQLAVPVNLLPPTAEAQAELVRKLNPAKDIEAKTPGVARWLQNVDNAKLIGGDARSLRTLEDKARKLQHPGGVAQGLVTAFKESFVQMHAGAKLWAADKKEKAYGPKPGDHAQAAFEPERERALAAGKLGEDYSYRWDEKEGWQMLDANGVSVRAASTQLKKFGPASQAEKGYTQRQEQRLSLMREWAESHQRVEDSAPDFDSEAGQELYEMAQGAAGSLPFTLLAIGTRGASIPATALAVKAQSYPTGILRGVDAEDADTASTLSGISAAVTELMPLGYIVKNLGKAGMGEFFAGVAGREVPSEILDSFNGSLIDTALTNPDKTWGEFARDLPRELRVAAGSALMMSGAIGGLHKGVQVLSAKRTKAEGRMADQETLEGLSKLVSEEPLRQRDPEAFQAFMKEMDDGTGISDLYVTADDLGPLLQTPDGARIAAAIPGLADQLAEAQQLGFGTVKVTLADYATHIAGSSVDAALLPKLRTAPDGYTYDESSLFFQEAETQLKSAADRITQADERVLTREEFEQQQVVEERSAIELAKPADRRSDTARRKRVSEMDPDERASALLTDDLTGLGNKRALEEAPQKAVKAMLDVDGLGATNDKMGHAAGDQLMRAVADALKKVKVEAFRIHGDEIVAQHEDQAALQQQLEEVNALLAESEITATLPDGSQLTRKGLQFSFGIGRNEEEADAKLYEHKAAREKRGERAPKGTLSGLVAKPATRNEAVSEATAKKKQTYEEYLNGHPSKKAVLRKDAETVETKIVEQFVASGRYTEAVAKLNAFAIREVYANLAARSGVLPSELYTRYPLSITPENVEGYNQFAGEKATTANLLALDAAKELLAGGADVDKVRETTGWHNGVDNKWRFEISDADAKLLVTGDFGEWSAGRGVLQLGDVIAHDKLFAAYPWLAQFRVSGLPLKDVVQGTRAAYDRESNRILAASSLNGNDLLSAVLHEVQHVIQNAEAFASGGGLNAAKKINDQLSTLVTDKEVYMRLAGEIEARNTQNRQTFTEADRRLFSPDMTADRDSADAIVIFNGEPSTLQPANAYDQTQRGSFDPNKLVISFLKSADLSTPLHEAGHFYLEVMAGIATGKDAPANVAADFDKILKWFGVTREQWAGMTLEEKRPHHEQWAESYELYLFENKAPSRELTPVFARFSLWLTQVYKSVKSFLETHPAAGKLNDEIRAVFDRLHASADAISDAEQIRGYELLFGSAAEAGVSEKDYAGYAAAGLDGTATAVADMRTRSLRDLKWLDGAKSRVLRDLQKTAKAKREELQKEVVLEIANEPIERARRVLKDPNPETGFKLDTTIVRELLPDVDLSDLRGMTHAKAGVHPDEVADMLGFDSGLHLITELIDAEPTASKIAGRVDQRMLEEHSELVDDRAIASAVNLAVHNEARARFLASGLKILTKSQIPAAQLAAAARAVANTTVGAKKIRDVHPAQYEAAEARANKEAITKVAKEPEKALTAQRAALLNNRLVRAATDALSDVDKGVAHFGKLQSSTAQGNMRGDFLTQLNALLGRFDIRTSRSLKQIDTDKQPLNAWIEAEAERLSAVVPDLPAWVLDENVRKHYKDMTVDEFRGLVDAVKALELLARREDKQYQVIRDMAFSDERAAIMARIREFNPKAFTAEGEPKGLEPKFIPKLFDSPEGSVSEKFEGEFLNVETITNMLEGGNFGQLHESLLGRLSNGVDRKAERLRAIHEQLKPLIDAYSFKEKRNFSRKQLTTVGGTAVTRENVLVMALLHGSKDGRERLANYGWSEQDQANAIRSLDARDLNLVEGVWSVFDKGLWPEMKALNERTRGKAPPKITPAAFRVNGRDLAGGYFRLKYDTNLDERAHQMDEGAAVKELLGGSLGMGAKTAQGTSTERKQGVTMRPRLDLGVLSETVAETVHDLELREAVADTMRLLNDTGIRNAIKNTAGVPSYRALVNRVREIAAPPRNPSGFIEKALTLARKNTVVTLMSGLGTALQNVTGLVPALMRVPAGRLLVELAKFYSPAMSARYQFVMEQSKYMRNRYDSYDRDLQNEANKLTVKGTILPDTATFLWFMGQVDKGVSVPVWSTAFSEGLKNFKNDRKKAIEYADHVVRQTQGSGRELDLAAIMSGHGGYGQLKKVFTMFYSYFNAQLGALVRAGAVSKRLAKKHPALAAALFTKSFLLIYAVPAVLTRMVFAGNQEEDEDWVHKYTVAMAKYGLGMFPLVRDVGSFAMAKFDTALPDYGLKVTAVQSGLEGVINGAVALTDIAQGEGTDRDTKNAVMGISYAVGLPGKLIYNTTSGVYEWLQNDGPVSDIIYGYQPTE